jgi:hypothetical protein
MEHNLFPTMGGFHPMLMFLIGNSLEQSLAFIPFIN